MRGLYCSVGVCLLVVAGCGGSSPTSPSPNPSTTPTRIIGISGTLEFGSVQVGQSKDLTFTIANSGNATLTITGLSITSGLSSIYTSSFANGGTIGAGGSQSVTVRFSPAAAQSYNGTIAVNGDQTSGTNTIAVSGSGAATTPPAGP